MKILVVGEMNPDLVMRDATAFPEPGKEVIVKGLLMALGGSAANTVTGLARLGDEASFLGRVGRDVWGDYCVDAMARAGVDTSRIVRDGELQTGITVAVTGSQDRAFITYLGTIAALRPEDVPASALEGFQHVHVGGYFLQDALRPGVGEIFRAAHARGLTTSLDTGFDPSETWGSPLVETLAETDVFLPNEVEVCAIARRADPLDALRALSGGRTQIVLKLGAQGCAAMVGGELVAAPTLPVKVVDTTGAGDAFNAGFLHAWLRRMPPRRCLEWGSACGSLSTREMGGQAGQPSAAEVEAALAGANIGSPQRPIPA